MEKSVQKATIKSNLEHGWYCFVHSYTISSVYKSRIGENKETILFSETWLEYSKITEHDGLTIRGQSSAMIFFFS